MNRIRSLVWASIGAGVGVLAVALAHAGEPHPQVTAGRKAYLEQCQRCHGEALEGRDHAPALKGGKFRENWNTKTARALYRRILSTMPLDKPGSLDPAEVLVIVMYTVAENGIQLPASVENSAGLDQINLSFAEQR